MIFADTGGLYALFVPSDPDHARAARWYAENREALVVSDYIVDEILTLLRARGEARRALEVGRRIFAGSFAHVHYLTRDDIADAWTLFRTWRDKDWSFTDCTSKVVMERLGIRTAFAFDRHFQQFGGITVVP